MPPAPGTSANVVVSGVPDSSYSHAFVQRLGDAGGDAAVQLPVGERRIDHGAAVVDGEEVADRRSARVEVDLDDGQVGAVREGAAGLGELGATGQPRLAVVPVQRPAVQRDPVDGGCGHTSDPHPGRAVRHDVVGRDLELIGDEIDQPGTQPPGGVRDGTAAELDRARGLVCPHRPARGRCRPARCAPLLRGSRAARTRAACTWWHDPGRATSCRRAPRRSRRR